jgi:hypothetical protein
MNINKGSIEYGINALGNIQGSKRILWVEEDVKGASLVEHEIRETDVQVSSSEWRKDR